MLFDKVILSLYHNNIEQLSKELRQKQGTGNRVNFDVFDPKIDFYFNFWRCLMAEKSIPYLEIESKIIPLIGIMALN
jgi:hypothetical protein